ncbi:MAG: DoxX family protein [Bdellovibrionales bacterium]|jgi:putative oxidoreductase|nr:DoxX family protein [Bdellovibrionales bacterium]
MNFLSRLHNDDLAKLLLRFAIGGLMIPHGIHKITDGIGRIETMLAKAGLPEFFAHGVWVGELIAPALIVFGVKTRASAAVVALTMLMSIYLAFRDRLMTLNQFGGWVIELNLLFMVGAMALVFSGSGRYAFKED